jgi:hypothetical protein
MSRPHHVAEVDWRRISNELRTRNLLAGPPRPTPFETLAAEAIQHIDVSEEVRRRTTVSSKWIFNTREGR